MSTEPEIAINGRTQIFGIIGNPVGHSLSPLIHNAAFQSKKINAAYIPLQVENAGASLKKGLQVLDSLKGFSVTIPHKAWACKNADSRDELTECCGAANTLIKDESGELRAYNTDGPGALEALRRNLGRLNGKRFLLLGYGGSATAIAHALLIDENPAVLMVHGRNSRKLNKFTDELNERHGHRNTLIRAIGFQDLDPSDVDIIIHTTPLGMQGQSQELPLPEEFLRDHHAVFDIVYTPARTPLLEAARRKKARTIPGYLMLLYQAVLQFELFTGDKAPENLMESELLRALRSRSS